MLCTTAALLLAVTGTGDVEVIVKPPTTAPRRDNKKRSRLVAEHQRRIGRLASRGHGTKSAHFSPIM